jgi:hypothetical protein
MSDQGREIIRKALKEEAKTALVLAVVILVWSAMRWLI